MSHDGLPDPEHLARLSAFASEVNETFAAKGQRDPARVPATLAKLHVYWKANPHLRLGQIIGNCAADSNTDPYHMEDDTLMRWLDNQARVVVPE
jgi:hypothetical protein